MELAQLDATADLFTLQSNVCDRCGATFETGRRSRFCALCAGPRATVQCPACDLTHEVPILAPHKLCLSCSADMEMTLASARVRFDQAKEQADALSVQLDADVAHADEKTRERFAAAVAARFTGQLGDRQLTTDQVSAAWAKALERGDDLSPLLDLYDRAQAAALAQLKAAEAVRAVEEAIER